MVPPAIANPVVAEVNTTSVAAAPPPAAAVPGTGAALPENVAPASVVGKTWPVFASTKPVVGDTNDCDVTVGAQSEPGWVKLIGVKLAPASALMRSKQPPPMMSVPGAGRGHLVDVGSDAGDHARPRLPGVGGLD